MNTYTWKIESLDYAVLAEGKSNVVNNINWSLIGTNSTLSSQIYGVQPIQLNAEAPFVNYNDLTEETVTNWLVSALGDKQVDELKKAVNKQIEAQTNPVTGTGLPWIK
jgi:hypothetical protein